MVLTVAHADTGRGPSIRWPSPCQLIAWGGSLAVGAGSLAPNAAMTLGIVPVQRPSTGVSLFNGPRRRAGHQPPASSRSTGLGVSAQPRYYLRSPILVGLLAQAAAPSRPW